MAQAWRRVKLEGGNYELNKAKFEVEADKVYQELGLNKKRLDIEEEKTFNIKALNEEAELDGCTDININKIKTILNFWAIKNWIKRRNLEYTKNHIVVVGLHAQETLRNKLEKRHEMVRFIIEYLYDKCNKLSTNDDLNKEELMVEFSVLELKMAYESGLSLFKLNVDLDDVEDALFYLSRIEAIKIEGGFLVVS